MNYNLIIYRNPISDHDQDGQDLPQDGQDLPQNVQDLLPDVLDLAPVSSSR